MFGALGKCRDAVAFTFVSRVSLERGTLSPRLRREVLPVRGTRALTKRDMKLNDALPQVVVDPDSYEVRVDGVPVTSEPARVLPLAQRYFLF